MTDKRFTLNTVLNFDYGISDYGEPVGSLKHICELLNELHSRNKRLEEKIQRERNSFRKTHKRWGKEAETKIKELSEENEELKQQINELNLKMTRDLHDFLRK